MVTAVLCAPYYRTSEIQKQLRGRMRLFLMVLAAGQFITKFAIRN